MKWYFACNNKSPEFYPLIKGAVISAVKNTKLEPYFIYDGEENELTSWLKVQGVKIIHHRVSFYDALQKYYDEHLLKIASGAFLRCDIPIIETEDEFVLYTDCDVLFLKDFNLSIEPKYFACSPQVNKNNYKDFNTGVMLINVKELKKSHSKFIDFIVGNLRILPTFDQSAYQIFYSGRNTKLPTIYNHKPYWGVDTEAFIVHFHGCKPITFTTDEALKNLPTAHYELYKKNLQAYDYYLDLYKNYCPEIQYNQEGMEKLKNCLYPIGKKKKTSFGVRIKNRLIKEYKTWIQKFKN